MAGIECKLNPFSGVSTNNAHSQKGNPLCSTQSASIGGLNPDSVGSGIRASWSTDHKAREMASFAWSIEETSTDYRAGNLHLTCKQSLATCTYLGLLLWRKFAHIHKRFDNVEVAVVHSKVEGTPAKLHRTEKTNNQTTSKQHCVLVQHNRLSIEEAEHDTGMLFCTNHLVLCMQHPLLLAWSVEHLIDFLPPPLGGCLQYSILHLVGTNKDII